MTIKIFSLQKYRIHQSTNIKFISFQTSYLSVHKYKIRQFINIIFVSLQISN